LAYNISIKNIGHQAVACAFTFRSLELTPNQNPIFDDCVWSNGL